MTDKKCAKKNRPQWHAKKNVPKRTVPNGTQWHAKKNVPKRTVPNGTMAQNDYNVLKKRKIYCIMKYEFGDVMVSTLHWKYE